MSCTGGPLGSTARIALTSLGRRSATGQPKAPDWEWVSRIAGPILSSKATSAVGVELLLLGEVDDGGELRGVELIEIRIAGLAGARELRVQMRLRPHR